MNVTPAHAGKCDVTRETIGSDFEQFLSSLLSIRSRGSIIGIENTLFVGELPLIQCGTIYHGQNPSS